MLAQQILAWSVNAALAILAIAFVVTTLRVLIGPTLPDRVLALDMLVSTAIGFMAVFAIKTGYSLYIDIAIALGLVGFLATVAFARFIISAGGSNDTIQDEIGDGDTPLGMPSRILGRRK